MHLAFTIRHFTFRADKWWLYFWFSFMKWVCAVFFATIYTIIFIFHKFFFLFFRHRVGQEPFGSFPPSEPYVTVSRHTAQALQSNLPFGIPALCFRIRTLRYRPTVFTRNTSYANGTTAALTLVPA